MTENVQIRRTTCRRILAAVLLISAIVISSGVSRAQLSSASINGSVHDGTGAIIVNASITLRNMDTAVQTRATSNSSGTYGIVSITPGRYTIEASAPSFSTKKVSEFTLTVGQTATFDFSLLVGAETAIVNVEATAPLLETSTANLGTVITVRQVNDLPLNGRNFTQLLQLTPGVAAVSTGQNNGGGFAGPAVAIGSATSFPAVNGQTNRSNFFLTDGLNNYGTILSTYDVPPIIDAIQEFKVVSHTDSAEYGGVLGGVVNVVTKSGTNDLHGSGFEFARNTVFDARAKFLKAASAKPDFSQNQFGGSIGGPVIIPKLYHGRNKTFFFGAYQGFRYTQTANNNILVPTEAELNGDLSDQKDSSGRLIPIYNPYSTRPNPSGTGYIRDVFPNNQIPKSLIDPRMVALAHFVYPTPTGATQAGTNAVDPTPINQTQNEFNVRVDHTFGTKDSAWFRYSFINSTQTSSGGIPGLLSTLATPGRNWGGSYVHIFNPSFIVQAQYARTTGQHNNTQRYQKATSSIFSQVGFSEAFAGGFQATPDNLIPSLGIDGGFAGGGETIQNTPKATDSHEAKATLTKIVGTHEIHFGGGYTTLTFESPIANSSLSFQTAQTADPQAASGQASGLGLASFLLNVPGHAERRNVLEKERPGGVFSSFVQDSWKTTPRLTLNLGVRYDITFIPAYGTEDTVGQQGGIETGDVDFTNGTYVLQKLPPACSVRGHAPCIPGDGSLPAHVVVDPRGKIPHNTYTNVGPRFGFAFRLDDKTVIRAGFGIVYDQWAAATQTAQNVEGSWPDTGQQIANPNNPNTGTTTPSVTAQDPFSAGISGNFPAPTPFEQVGYFFDPHIKNAYSDQYNVGVARQMSEAMTVTLNYVGSSGHRLDVGGFYNTAPTPGPGDPRLRSPYPYIAPTYWDRSAGTSNYNALQLSVERRYKNDFSYSVAYTWSKSINTGGDGFFGVEGGVPQDPYHPGAFGSRSVAGTDLRNVLSVNTLYSVPLGKGKGHTTGNGVLDYVLGNWQVNNIFLARSGMPFTPSIGGDSANTGNGNSGYMTANLIGDPNKISQRTADEFFNIAAYAAPPIYTFGTAGRNSLRSAGFWNLDTSLFRKFPLGERYQVELRAEAFNVFNHPTLDIPNGRFGDANFGRVTGTASVARQLQMGAKFTF